MKFIPFFLCLFKEMITFQSEILVINKGSITVFFYQKSGWLKLTILTSLRIINELFNNCKILAIIDNL